MSTPVRAFLRKTDRRNEDTGATLLTLSEYWGVDVRSNRTTDEARADSLVGYKIVQPDDLVMNIMLAWKGAQGVSPYHGVISPAYEVYEPNRTMIEPAYLHHLMRCPPVIADMASRSYGIMASRLRLYWDRFKEMRFDLLSLAEQRAIAAYLDRETARIDTLVAAKEAQQEALRQRQEHEMTAVTLGGGSMRPDGKMEGLPTAWKLIPLKHLCEVQTAGCYGDDDGENLLEASCIGLRQLRNDGSIDYDDCETRFYTSSEMDKHSTRPGDLLVVKSSGSVSNVVSGKANLCTRNGLVPSNFLLRLRPTGIDSELLLANLRSFRFRQHVLQMVAATTYPNLKLGEYLSIEVPVPPNQEQVRLLEKLRNRASDYSEIAQALEISVTKLKERRQALITHAVTGNLKIPMEAIHA